MQDFKKLDVWAKAHALVLSAYKSTQTFPKEETFGTTMQLRRNAVAIPTRLAAASARENGGDKLAEVHKAIAHASELEYTILLVKDLGYLRNDEADTLTDSTVEVRKMLYGLLRKL